MKLSKDVIFKNFRMRIRLSISREVFFSHGLTLHDGTVVKYL